MMINPPIQELVNKTGNRYVLVIETAKRARQLVDGENVLCDTDSKKEVTQAVQEIYNDKVGYVNFSGTEKE